MKFIQKCISPLALGLCCLVAILVLNTRGSAKPQIARFWALLGLLIMCPPSLPVVANALLGQLEGFSAPDAQFTSPNCETLVVLGGTVSPQWDDNFNTEEIAGSRLLQAVRLYRAQKAKRIITTSGIGYFNAQGIWRTEAEDMRDILVTMGIPYEVIVIEPRAMNTEENAKYTAEILRNEHLENSPILLVSSSYHMQRATNWFRLQGLTVYPVGAGRSVKPTALKFLDFVPSAAALTRSTAALKEYLGMLPLLF